MGFLWLDFYNFFSGDMITIFKKPLNETCIRVYKYNNNFDVQKNLHFWNRSELITWLTTWLSKSLDSTMHISTTSIYLLTLEICFLQAIWLSKDEATYILKALIKSKESLSQEANIFGKIKRGIFFFSFLFWPLGWPRKGRQLNPLFAQCKLLCWGRCDATCTSPLIKR